jgi:hypothetical protein
MKVVAAVIALALGGIAYGAAWAIQNSIARSEGYSGVTGAGAYQDSILAGLCAAIVAYPLVLGIARVLGIWSEDANAGDDS